MKPFKSRRKFLTSLSAVALGGLAFGYQTLKSTGANAKAQHGKSVIQPHPRAGINVSGIAYWGTEFPFVNLMHQSSEWVSQPAEGAWGSGPALALDKHGWVRKLETGCRATKILCSGDVKNYPSGIYHILYDGEGEIQLNPKMSKLIKVADGELQVEVDATKGDFAIEIVSTNQKSYLRNIRVVESAFLSSYQINPWRPSFLSHWSSMACLRFMDLMKTNNSQQVHWTDRPQLNDASYMEKGVPVELLIDLANRQNIDPWFCMPHQASGDYIKQFATTVKKQLKPNLKAWVEYSNEVWNGGFKQHQFASEQGQTLKLGTNAWESAFHYNAHRSVLIFKIWESVFKDKNRIVNVIASQAANAWLGEQLLKQAEVAHYADVLAIAPYVSLNVSEEGNDAGISANKVSQWSVEKLFNHIERFALPETTEWITNNKKLADTHGIKLVAYEAGQHLVGFNGAENNNKLTDLFLKANADDRMGQLYTKYLQRWQQSGGDLICLFNSTEGWSKWGSWGLLTHYKKTAAESPKFRAVMDWAKSLGQAVKY